MKYSDKLKDPRWQKKRTEILQRDNWECQACGDGTSTLHVHHKEYHGNPWDAPSDSLETLCEKCHKDRTELNKKFMSMSSLEVNDFMSRFMELDFMDMATVSIVAMKITKAKNGTH